MEKEFSEDICGRENYGYVEPVDVNCYVIHGEDCTIYKIHLPNGTTVNVTDEGCNLFNISCLIDGKSVSLEEHPMGEIQAVITSGSKIKMYTLQLKEEIDLEKIVVESLTD